jgi:hypothetical protein
VPIGKAPARVLVLLLLWQLPPTHCGKRAPRLDQRALQRDERDESSRHGSDLVRRNDVARFISAPGLPVKLTLPDNELIPDKQPTPPGGT